MIEEALVPNERVVLHRRAPAALEGRSDLARLAYHAEGAGDGDAVLRFAPAAAERAAAAGAHREAAAQYARALRFADGLAPAALAELLEHRSHECDVADQPFEASEDLQRALHCYGSSAIAAARAMRSACCRRSSGAPASSTRPSAPGAMPSPCSNHSAPGASWRWRTRTWRRWP